jgi:hypothetical protein
VVVREASDRTPSPDDEAREGSEEAETAEHESAGEAEASPSARIPSMAPATTESISATTPGTAINGCATWNGRCSAIAESRMPASSSYGLVTKYGSSSGAISRYA